MLRCDGREVHGPCAELALALCELGQGDGGTRWCSVACGEDSEVLLVLMIL